MSAQLPNLESDKRNSFYVQLGVVLWSSFLAACVASVLFFAVVDPQLLRDAGPALFENLNREAGYALGFFFFWAMSALASFISVYLMRSERGPSPRQNGAPK